MQPLLLLITLIIAVTLCSGAYLTLRPAGARSVAGPGPRRLLLANLALFGLALLGLLGFGVAEVLAQPVETGRSADVSVGFGLAMIGIGLPTAVATLAAALAVGPVGSAALAVIAEKPEAFGRSLIYLGLAEGIAIYGLVVSILMLGRL